jgi:hypothetical protein
MKHSQRRGAAILFKILLNSTKFYYFIGLVATSPTNEHPIANLWFVGYYNRSYDALALFWFWMKQSQRQRAAMNQRVPICLSVHFVSHGDLVYLIQSLSNLIVYLIQLM